MKTLAPGWTVESIAASAAGPPATPLIMVVGYDGSPPARHALDHAADLLRDRKGALEVVFVAHLPVGATLSAAAVRRGPTRAGRTGTSPGGRGPRPARGPRPPLAFPTARRRGGRRVEGRRCRHAPSIWRHGRDRHRGRRLSSPVSPHRRICRIERSPRRYFPRPGRALKRPRSSSRQHSSGSPTGIKVLVGTARSATKASHRPGSCKVQASSVLG